MAGTAADRLAGVIRLSEQHGLVLRIRDADVVGRSGVAAGAARGTPGLERAAGLAELTAATTEPQARARPVHSRLTTVDFTMEDAVAHPE